MRGLVESVLKNPSGFVLAMVPSIGVGWTHLLPRFLRPMRHRHPKNSKRLDHYLHDDDLRRLRSHQPVFTELPEAFPNAIEDLDEPFSASS
jgi:hypothetical protein